MTDKSKSGKLIPVLATLAVIVIVGGAVLGRIVFQPFWIPSGSMKPALLVGDYIAVRRLGSEDPARGDVVVFRESETRTAFVFRIVGLPGETVQMVSGQVVVDGVTLPQDPLGPFEEVYDHQGPIGSLPACASNVAIGETCMKQRLAETLPEGRRIEVLEIGASRLDETPQFKIPENHYFVLGDNRDNAADSRMVRPMGRGLVHRDEITGRVSRVIFSSEGALWNVLRWRKDRFFQEVR